MGYYIDGIYLEENEQYSIKNFIDEDDKQQERNDYLGNLSKINIFLGSNNSGKSNLMRTILKNKELKFIPKELNFLQLHQFNDELNEAIDRTIEQSQMLDYANIKKNMAISKIDYLLENNDWTLQYYSLFNHLKQLYDAQNYNGEVTFWTDPHYETINEAFKKLVPEFEEKLSEILKDKPNIYSFKKLYIPTLRGLRSLFNEQGEVVDLYKQRTIKDYFNEEDSDLVFTGLDLYQDLQNLLLGSLSDREKVVEYQKFLGDTFFGGEPITLIPSIGSDVVTVKIGDEQEMKIHDLGDGIQSIIIQTFPLFAHIGEKILVFIEEPELYLHPGLQRKLLETFMRDEFSDFQFFLTTHSNHLLDVTLDLEQISIYSFKKTLEEGESKERRGMFTVENVSNEENDLLDILGVQNSSVYLSNCTIWVEGITDRYYIRRYLKLYQEYHCKDTSKHFREDYHYSFVEYSGNNITHWSFLDGDNDEEFSNINVDRVCSKLFLIADEDGGKKLPRHERLAEKLQERFYSLKCREIENLIGENVLKKVIADYEGEKVDDLIFDRDINWINYKNNYLGRFINNRLKNKKRKTYASKSGTITDKLGFCKRAIKYTNNYDDLSEEAIELAEKIYNFIISRNPNRV